MVSQNRHPQSSQGLLGELAGLYGVQTGYRDTRGIRRESPAQSIVRVLWALGAEVHPEDGPPETERGRTPATDSCLRAAIRARRAELAARIVEPVVVAWGGALELPAMDVSADGRNDIEAV